MVSSLIPARLLTHPLIVLEALGELRDKPAGTIRIICTDDQIEMCLRPMLAEFLRKYPDITLEFYGCAGEAHANVKRAVPGASRARRLRGEISWH